jgi:hypothetical protein
MAEQIETTRHVHQSGFPATTKAEMKTALEYFTSAEVDADVITLTAVTGQGARQAVWEWANAKGWHWWMPTCPGCDGAVLSAKPISKRKQWRLTRLLLRTNRRTPIRMIAGKVEGHGWFGSVHLPAHTGGLRPSWPTRVFLSALAGLRIRATQMRGRKVIGGDWNLDLRRDKMLAVLTRGFPGFRFSAHDGQKPTFPPRVIDGMMGNRMVREKAETLKQLDGFDHRGVLTVWGKRRWRRA